MTEKMNSLNSKSPKPDVKVDPETEDKPDYIISQSTLTSLTLLSGSGPSDADIGLANCSGKPDQQWIHNGKSLLWGENKKYCLTPNDSNNALSLGDASTSATNWVHDKDECFGPEGSTKVMDVPWEAPRTAVILYTKHGGANQLWWTYSELEASLANASPAKYPFPASDQDTYKQEVARTICNWLTPVTESLPYQRDVADFPGTVSSDEPRVTQKVGLDLSVLGQTKDFRMTVPQDWQATSMYVPPNEVIEVVLPDTLSAKRAAQIKVRVSAHVDILNPQSANVKGSGKFLRMPIVSDIFDLAPGVNKIHSQFGGHLIFVYSEGENFVVNAEVRKIVEAPYFRLDDTTVDQWQKEVKKGVPYALLETDLVVALIPKTDAEKVTKPSELMKRYDDVISMLNYAAGFDEKDPPPRGKFWLVSDKQITAGSAHAGFPAMFDRTYYNMGSENTPYDWVTWHELGHDYQQMAYWAGAYGSESTVNLYSLYIQKQLFNEDRLEKQGDYNRAADHVDAGMTFEEADVWEKLVFLMEIKWAFPDKDWEMFRQLRKNTRALSDEDAKALAADRQKQFDHAYKNLSKIVGKDLINTYNRWQLKISKEAQDEIAALKLPKAPGDLSHRTVTKD